MRVFGSLAYWYHCGCLRNRIQANRPSPIQDIDLVARFEDKMGIQDLMRRLGWKLDPEVGAIPEIRCSVLYLFEDGQLSCRCDIYYDTLDFCHSIDIRGRLNLDEPTIPLAELLLSKLQIRERTAADLFDMQMLLLEHEVGAEDWETINRMIIGQFCGRDWGLCRTALEGLTAVENAAQNGHFLSPGEKTTVTSRIGDLRFAIQSQKKTVSWRLRNCVGDRMRWYQAVDPIAYSEPGVQGKERA